MNLFIPSELRWQEKGLTLRQETRFPEESVTRLTLACDKPTTLSLRIRYPAWAAGPPVVKINGRAQKRDGKPSGYMELKRAWKSGDRVEITLPMSLRQEAMPDNPNRVALLYGPIVLAGALGPQDREAPRIPVFVSDGRPLIQRLKPFPGKTLTLQTQGVGRPADITLIPYYAMHHQRYSVYWDLFTEAEWQRREAEYRAEQERLRALERRTVDMLAIGEMQPERDHNLQGEKTGAGDFQGRKWRHAVDGGWFSFEMKVLPDQPVDLVLTYWGSDVGGREFDILVDGEKIATQVLNNNRPERFFDVTHPLPESLTRGKQKVTIRLQAHPHRMAGGLFGCRVVRR